MNLEIAWVFILFGLLSVTLIDALGSVASRKLNFTYAYLTPISLIVYSLIGFYLGQKANLSTALISAALVGVYDATIGWTLAVNLKANFGRYRDQTVNMTLANRIFAMMLIALSCAYLGYQVASR
jgi:hypothetical protein